VPGAAFLLLFLQVIYEGKRSGFRSGFVFGVTVVGEIIREVMEAPSAPLVADALGQTAGRVRVT
jgi:hypothetical protein